MKKEGKKKVVFVVFIFLFLILSVSFVSAFSLFDWIKDVFQDKTLAIMIKNITDRKEMFAIINKHLSEKQRVKEKKNLLKIVNARAIPYAPEKRTFISKIKGAFQ